MLCDKNMMWQGSCAVVGADMLPKAGTCAPIQMRLEIPHLYSVNHMLLRSVTELANTITVHICSLVPQAPFAEF